MLICRRNLNLNINLNINQNINKVNFIELYNDLINNRKIPLSLKLPIYQTNKYANENSYNKSLKNIKNRSLICLDGYTANNVEIADLYDRTNNYLYHIKRGTKNIRVLSSQIANGALLLHYYKHYHQYYDYNNIGNNIGNNTDKNNNSKKLLLDIHNYVTTHKIDVINSKYKYVFGIIIPSSYNISNISYTIRT